MKPLSYGLWFLLSLDYFDVISMIDKSTDHDKLLYICMGTREMLAPGYKLLLSYIGGLK